MEHKNVSRWPPLPIVLLLMAALFLHGAAFADLATAVTVEPPSQNVGIGATFALGIYVVPGTAIAGMQFNLSFDPSLVTANGVTEGNLLSQGGASTFFMPGTISNTAGIVTGVAGAIITPGQTVSSPGTFATISFTATAAGTSALHLSNVIVGNPMGQAVPITVSDGQVIISAAPPPTYTITFDTDPEATGSITFAGVSYSDGNTVSKTAATYAIVASPGAGYYFSGWQTAGHLLVTSPTSATTACMVSGAGTLRMVQTAVVATTVTVQPPTKVVGIGDTFTVDIFVDPDTAIAGVQFSLSFSPSLVTANGVTEGNLLSQGGASTFFMPGTINNTAGTISNVAGAIITPGQTVSSPGTFATISFTATAAGTSALHLSNVIVGNPQGQAVPITLSDGSVTITNAVTVSIDAPDEVAEGSDFIVDVAVNYVENFNSCGFDVAYDETIITVTDVTGGEIDGHTVQVGFGDWSYIPAGPDQGRIRVITTIPGTPAPGVTGTGYIAQIHYHVLGSDGQTSAIHLERAAMYDYQAKKIATTTRDDTIIVGVSLVITTTGLPDGKVGDVYTATLAATGGKTPYTWNATGLPGGLTCSAAGVMSGTPVGGVGVFPVTVTVTDAQANSKSKPLVIIIWCKPGDANMDGVVDTGDITKVKRIYFELDLPTPCADVNGDGFIDTGDITAIKAIYFGP